MERSCGGIAAMRHQQSRGSQRNMSSNSSSTSSDSDLDASVEHASPAGHSYETETRRRLWKSFGSRASQGDTGSDTESARVEKLGSSRTSTGTMKYEPPSKNRCESSGNRHVKPFFSSTGSCKRGSRSREPSTSPCHTDDSYDRKVVTGGRNCTKKTPNADCERPDRFSEKVENVCKKYGITQESIEDILSGKHSAERNHNRDECNNSECSSDGFREEMLIYLLNERMKLKAKLRAQKGKPHRPTYSERQNAKRDSDGVYFKELNEVTPDEMKQISQMWDRPGMNNSSNETVYHHPVRNSAPYGCSSSESSAPPISYANKEVLNTGIHGNVPDRRNQHAPVDLMISHEASSLQDEIDELMDSLERSGVINAQAPQYDDNCRRSKVQVCKKQSSCCMQKVVEDDDDDASVVEVSGLVKPIKVPLRPAKPDLCDAQVLTDETARERELQMYESLDRDLNRGRMRSSESDGAYQTDNTRITKDGMSWDITESYLKEEERRMLQEKKRAELLLQLKKGPSVKSETLQDHYNKWLQRKSGSHKSGMYQSKQVGETTENVEQENCEQNPCRVAPRGSGTKSVTCGRNIFRRNKGNKMISGGLSCSLGCGSSQLSSRSDAGDDTSSGPRDDVKPDNAGAAQHNNRDVYIKGSWDPRTGAVKISNDLDSSYSVNKNQMLDDYVNFLKQSPGNWNQEQESANSLAVEHEIDGATPLRIDERALERQESNDGMPEPEKFYSRPSRVDMESSESTPRSSDRESLASSDSARKMYERDEFYPSTNPMPMQSPTTNGGINPQPFAMGFRDPYMPHVRMGGGFYSPTFANMSLMQGVADQVKGSGAEHHHHYHYRCRESHRKCGHRRRHSCRHGHKHTCSKKKHSSKKAVESNVVKSHDVATDDLRVDNEHKPLVTMADRCVVQKQVLDESQDDVSSPSFGVKDNVTVHGGQVSSGDVTPVNMHNIITSTGQAKGTDFVKVVTYHTSVDNVDEEIDVQLEEDQAMDQSCMNKYFMCGAGKDARNAKYEPLRGASLTPTTYQGTPSSRANSNVGVVASDQSKRLSRGPRRHVEDRTQSPSGSNTPVSSANSSPSSGYPHVFRRRAHSRSEGPVTCGSPFSKLEQFESCKQMQDAACENVCPYEHDTGAESSEQFTFRSTSGESPKRDASPPMYKTRLIYVGNN